MGNKTGNIIVLLYKSMVFLQLACGAQAQSSQPKKAVAELGEVWGGQQGWWGCRTCLRQQVRWWEGRGSMIQVCKLMNGMAKGAWLLLPLPL